MLKTCLKLPCLVVVAGLIGCGGEPVKAPTGYLEWNAKDGTFRIDYPNDWEADGGGKQSIQWARFKKGSAEIYVNVRFSESALADVMGAGGGMMGVGGALGVDDSDIPSPVAAVHAQKKDEVAEDYSNYSEEEAIAIRPSLGEGRKSEFSAAKTLGTVKGYRATIINKDRGITVLCTCSESDWPTLQPAFDKILDQMTRGTKRT